MRSVREAWAVDSVIVSVENLNEAQQRLHDERLDCVVVAYHFDEVQAIRLISYLRDSPEHRGYRSSLCASCGLTSGGVEEAHADKSLQRAPDVA